MAVLLFLGQKHFIHYTFFRARGSVPEMAVLKGRNATARGLAGHAFFSAFVEGAHNSPTGFCAP
jgi:hypothetical protein